LKQQIQETEIEKQEPEANLLLQYREKNALLELHNTKLENIVHEQNEEIKKLRNDCTRYNNFLTAISPNTQLSPQTSKAQAIAWSHQFIHEMTYEEIDDFVLRITEIAAVSKTLQSKKSQTIKLSDLAKVKQAETDRKKPKPVPGKKPNSPYERMFNKLTKGAITNGLSQAKAETQAKEFCQSYLNQLTGEAKEKYLGH
jgi:hypothetical protein